jgi:hypothetical protein
VAVVVAARTVALVAPLAISAVTAAKMPASTAVWTILYWR